MVNSSKTGRKLTIPLLVLLTISFSALPAQAKYGGGTGEPNDPYLIFDANQMNAIGLHEEDWDKHFILMADIDLAGFTGASFNIIGTDYDNPFRGVFDGNSHTISNFTYTSTARDNVGLFGYARWGAEIKDVGLIDPNVDAGLGDYVGSLVGSFGDYGTITNCYVESGSVAGKYRLGGLVGYNFGTITNCYSTAGVSGNSHVGGLVGRNWYGTITVSYSTGSVSGKRDVGGLVGSIYYGTITNCCSTGSVSGNYDVGGLVGENGHGTIANCYSSGSVAGDWHVGGLVGYNGVDSTITNCCSTGSVEGNTSVGGLVGDNWGGIISNCYSNASVSGEKDVGGLVGENKGTIYNCSSTGSVLGNENVGGLVGENYSGTITDCYSIGSVAGNHAVGGMVGWNGGRISDCYSFGSVSGTTYVGGLVGENHSYSGTISNCYSTGEVSGDEPVGGLVGRNLRGTITNSFWDIQTSGRSNSAGGTGLPTAEMQTESTFTDAGWDFVGKTVNGIEDIWFIPQQDYPHLWWEGMQVPMKLTPRTLNCRSKGNWVKAHLTLPQGFTVEDVDSNRPAVLHSFGFQSAPLYVSVNKKKLVEIKAAFEREAVCSLTGNWPEALTVAGFLTDGNIFLGTSTVRMITPGLKDIAELSLYWLNADCVHPDFCNGIDMNRDSMVNLLDYALFLNSQVEFISE